MNRPDDLQHLWKTQPVDPDMKGEEMRKLGLQKMEKFDRMIQWRNRIEGIAALAVAAFFAYAAWMAPNGIARLGSGIIVGGALWIVYYIRQHGAEPADPNPDQTLAGYQSALARKYDHQIR